MNLLTEEELEALRLSGKLAERMRRIIGDGPTASHDWSEIAQCIHALQHAIMAQAAARAYPNEFRLLGGVVEVTVKQKSDQEEIQDST